MDTKLTRRGLLAAVGGAALLAPWSAGAQTYPELTVTKDPSCGCCAAWIEHMRAAGFSVTVRDAPVNPLKVKLGVPRDLASCHTAQIDRYVVEGHVPASAVKRLLAQRPDAIGIAVPGMPVGSPGMEVEGTEPDTYDVVLFGPQGRRVFARYRGGQEA
ncbi:DUF411 domain-containing protein [Enterovirga aerilata]|uniref:DUF411 domain-containing protein n=1 Tax=Enterovirga aerilata TaxID=2730920 RepID=A0A849I253_9HYPH|nr:DUF411 domain-containing protein [Enterovirga sp. DB1703]NNM73886.1 DUF411 domain-containing protein [Enterovirga sp. DB1703]